MKKYIAKVMRKVTDSELDVYEIYTCDLKSSEVNSAIEEYKNYMQKTGNTYDRDEYKHPTLAHFVELYFGDEEDFGYITPDRYRCTNTKVAEKLFSLLKNLAYHDTFNQKFCSVEQNRNYIEVTYGDY